MLTPGYRYTLPVSQVNQHEVILAADNEEMKIPRQVCPEGLKPGQNLEVFVFLDRNNKVRITTHMPFAQVGEFAFLQVESVGPHGAFLNWGIEKDLLVPHPEQEQKMLEGRRYLVRLCHDDSNRPIGSSRLDRYLEQENSDLREGDEVELLVWAFTDLGAR